MIVAGIDIGTNTSRLLIAEYKEEEKCLLEKLRSERRITRLGTGISKNSLLSHDAIYRTVAAIDEFCNILETYNIYDIVIVATSAVREADNRDELIEAVKSKTSLEIEVLSGKGEAERTYLGILSGIGEIKENYDDLMIIDIGGGSTEFIITRKENHHKVKERIDFISINMGIIYLTESYITSAPLKEREHLKLKDKIEQELNMVKNNAPSFFPVGSSLQGRMRGLIGTAGTITTLASISKGLTDYNSSRINNYTLKLDIIEDIFNQIAPKDINDRKKIPGLDKGREDIIVAGTVILMGIMKKFRFKEILVSDYGLKEGIIIDRMQKIRSQKIT